MAMVTLSAMMPGCVTTLGYIPEQVPGQGSAPSGPTYAQVRQWALNVADGYDSRSTASRQSRNLAALLAGAGAAAVTAMGAFGTSGAALAALPIGTGFLSTTGVVYSDEPKAVVYRYASDNVKELVRRHDAELARTSDDLKEASCLQGNVYAVMRRVGEYIALQEPKNVSERLKAAGTSDAAAVQRVVATVTSDYTDLKRVAHGCPAPLAVPESQVEVPVGGSTTITVTGGAPTYTAVAMSGAATDALTVSPPAATRNGAIIAVTVNREAKPGRYGVLVKDDSHPAIVVVVTAVEPVVPSLSVVGALEGRPIEKERETLAAVVSGGVRGYKVETSDSKALVARLEGSDGDRVRPLKVTASRQAVDGREYTVSVEDGKRQRELVAVRVKPRRFSVDPLDPPGVHGAAPGTRLRFHVSGGTPEYKAVAETGIEHLAVNLESAILTIAVRESAVGGDVYRVNVTDAVDESREIRIPIARADDPAAAPTAGLIGRAQTALKAAGHDPGGIDGVLGPKTERALRAFQADAKLKETGALDPATRKALKLP